MQVSRRFSPWFFSCLSHDWATHLVKRKHDNCLEMEIDKCKLNGAFLSATSEMRIVIYIYGNYIIVQYVVKTAKTDSPKPFS